MGEMASRSDCSFPVSTTTDRHSLKEGNNATGHQHSSSPANSVSLCHFHLASPKLDGVYSWQKGLASLSTWLGGPSTDASNSSDGNKRLLSNCCNRSMSIFISIDRCYRRLCILRNIFLVCSAITRRPGESMA